MVQHEVTRTLVKSQPEVWAQCSEADSLDRHLSGSFGEIRITRLEPEHSVAWEGEQVSGTVKIEPSAWGTRVTMAVQVEGDAIAPQAQEESIVPALTAAGGGELAESEPPAQGPQESEPAPEPELAQAPSAPPPDRWSGLFARMRAQFRRAADPPARPEAEEPEAPEESLASEEPAAPEPPQPAAPEPPQPELPQGQGDAVAALQAALESLGQAHHRPYSRA